MTKQTDTAKTVWQPVDPTTLPADHAKLYATVQAAMKANAIAYKALKTAEDACSAAILKGQVAPEGKEYKVAFRYGLAIAIVDTEAKTSRKGTLSLADWLKDQAA